MRAVSGFEPPFSWHGAAVCRPGRVWRLPETLIDTVSDGVAKRARCASGVRVRFATDAKELEINLKLSEIDTIQHMSLVATAGADIYAGAGESARFVGFAAPESAGDREARAVIGLPGRMENITINLPRNARAEDISIALPCGAATEPPQEYAHPLPVVFYGSSITEGGAASRPGCAYTSLLCRRLDCDYINLGFAGSARGEIALAEYIATLQMSAFVLDYDHNARDVSELSRTHGAFFAAVRRARPNIPILMLSRPNYLTDPADAGARRAVILQTYERAKSAGDRAVFFFDGERLLAGPDATSCTVDGIHPNDAGFARMAERLYPVLKDILEGKYDAR